MINNEENKFVINDRFPDMNFRNFIVENVLNRKDGTSDIFESDLETLSQIKELNMEKHKQIKNIQGIEYFKSLEKLDISFNTIGELDVSKLLNLKELYAYQCRLETIKLCPFGKLETLDVTLNYLSFLDLDQQPMLESLSCSNNDLTELDVRNCSLLKELYCQFNYLGDLDLSENKELNTLYCESYKKLNSVTAHSYKNLLDGDVYGEVLDIKFIDSEGIRLKECGVILRTLGVRSIYSEGEMSYIDKEDYKEMMKKYNVNEHDWNQFDKDIKRFGLENYIKYNYGKDIVGEQGQSYGFHIVVFEGLNKHFNQNDWYMNHQFPDVNFRKAILENVLERNDGTTDIFESDLEVLAKETHLLIPSSKIHDLTGIETFKNLTVLDVSYNPLNEINLSALEVVK